MTAQALDGVRVLDLTRYIPGPYCTRLLADLGADVIKIEEPPFGDPTRAVPPAAGEDSALHAALNRGKRSIAVNLRSETGAEVARRLAARADVLVEAFRPGVLARRGLGPDTLRAADPRLVYCSVSGYGQDGPLAGRAGHDVDYVALGGYLGGNRDAEGRPVLPTTQVADMTGGLLAAFGILAALQARERTGRGQLVDVSLLEGVLALMTVPAVRRLAGGELPTELTGSHACYNVYRCRDGRFLAVGALEPKFWEALCRTLGHPEKVPRQWESGQARRETLALFASTFASRDRDAWLRDFAEVEACVEPVLELDEALDQPQLRARGVLSCPVRLSETPAQAPGPAPALGQHTAEVLGEAGYPSAEIASLREAGVIA